MKSKDIVKFKGYKHSGKSAAEEDVYKLRIQKIPLVVGEEYEVYSKNKDGDVSLMVDEVKPSKLSFPHSFFELIKEAEVEEDTTNRFPEVIFAGGNWEDKKRRNEERYKKNPYLTTLPEYQKMIDDNSEKARNLRGH